MKSAKVATPESPSDTLLERAAYSRIYPLATTQVVEASLGASLPAELRAELASKLSQSYDSVPTLEDSILSGKHAEQVEQFVSVVQKNLASIFTVKEAAETRVKQIDQMLKALRDHCRNENRPMTLGEIKARQFFLEERERLKQDLLQKSGQDRDFYYAVHGEVLSGYASQLRQGRIVITPGVEKAIEKVLAGLELGETVFIHGDTGGGKTEIARVAAKRYSGKDPVVVRGYPKMAQEELFGHLTLKSKQDLKRAADVVELIDKQVAIWTEEHPEAKESDKKSAKKNITDYILNDRDVSVLDYLIGAQYKAMEEGRVIIYDESNAFPDDLRRKLNDLKTKKPGEFVTIQEDGGRQFEVAQGYGEIETANVGLRYGEGEKGKGRSTYSADERDRRQCVLEYSYLSQATDGSYFEVKRAENKELFTIALAALVDENGNLVAPQNTLHEVWKLAQFAALTQQAFSNTLAPEHELSQGGSKVKIKTDVLISPRGLQSILNAWRSDGYQYELGHYVAENLLPRVFDASQRALLYNLGTISKIFVGNNWPPMPDLDAGKVNALRIESPKNLARPIELVSRLEVIEAIWGAAPERSEWRAQNLESNTLLTEEDRIDLMKKLTGLSKDISQAESLIQKELQSHDRNRD